MIAIAGGVLGAGDAVHDGIGIGDADRIEKGYTVPDIPADSEGDSPGGARYRARGYGGVAPDDGHAGKVLVRGDMEGGLGTSDRPDGTVVVIPIDRAEAGVARKGECDADSIDGWPLDDGDEIP